MRFLLRSAAVMALIASMGATGALAKGHDQGAGPNGSPEGPAGSDVSGTVDGAQGLGKGKGKDNQPDNPGKSGDGGSGRSN